MVRDQVANGTAVALLSHRYGTTVTLLMAKLLTVEFICILIEFNTLIIIQEILHTHQTT